MEKRKKPFAFRTNTKQIVQNMQRDFEELTTKQEMVTVEELRREIEKNYIKDLYSFLEKGKKECSDDFIIEVFRWHEVGDRKIWRKRLTQMLLVPSRPRPGRAYYYYDASEDILKFLWDLPPKSACKKAYANRFLLGVQIPDAIKTIIDYYDGTLERRAEEINKQIIHHRSSYNERRTNTSSRAIT